MFYAEFINGEFISNGNDSQQGHIIDIIKGNIRVVITTQVCFFHNNRNVKLIVYATSESFYCSQVGVIFIEYTTFSSHNVIITW